MRLLRSLATYLVQACELFHPNQDYSLQAHPENCHLNHCIPSPSGASESVTLGFPAPSGNQAWATLGFSYKDDPCIVHSSKLP
mmetsp:Transcript_9679/g.15162  ORF Transcript_9679/g.15162 Transcript_9679/m.15162 type:complete len:83 (+) Transcript_9679:172-420(+)